MRFLVVVLFVVVFILSTIFIFINNQAQDIKIGLLYSKTGTMSTEESGIAKMLHFGVEKINEKGGIKGRKLTIVEYDGKSDSKEFAKGAQELINQDIKYIFGCWTSASRKAVKPVVEKNDAILFYPVQYEGAEQSPNIIYLGATPNQQLNPTISYIKNNFGNKIYMIGSDYIYPRMSGVYLDELANKIDLEIIGESYHLLGAKNFKDVVSKIKIFQPDAIINTLNGDSNKAFFKELYQNKITPKELPVFSLSIDESSLVSMKQELPKEALDGHFATWNYFSSIATNENKTFLKTLQERFGKEFTLTNASYNIYLAVALFEKGFLTMTSDSTKDFITQVSRASLNGLSGVHYISKTNNHTHKQMRIGKILDDQFQIVWESNTITHPNPYVKFQEQSFWDMKLEQFYRLWNNSWQASQKADTNE
jgi:urea transport system substrate-binding protein